MKAKEFLRKVLELTLPKLQQEGILAKEYHEVEQVPPKPGDSWGQHDAMVSLGLCNKAVKNERKNRYCNLFPFDKNIVNVESDPDFYINASWMQVLPWLPDRRFIVTMAPMHPNSYSSQMKSDFDENVPENTCPDFWKMIWETDAKIIVMLCKVQAGFTGCSEYFPTKSGDKAKHGDYKIENVKTIEDDTILQREFVISRGEETKKVTHLQFTAWPNYGVPGSAETVSKFIKLVSAKQGELKSGNPELVIHCSGGIGRSGAFLTSYAAYSYFSGLKDDQTPNPEELNLIDIVKSLRMQRHPWMVEGLHQYEMAYLVILNLLKELSN